MTTAIQQQCAAAGLTANQAQIVQNAADCYAQVQSLGLTFILQPHWTPSCAPGDGASDLAQTLVKTLIGRMPKGNQP